MPPDVENNNLISIDDIILRAKNLGVDFGKGDPKERLRYLTKIGLLPHAKRKSFNGHAPNGAYPEYIIGLLQEIDTKIKNGKSIQEIKKEKERKILFEVPLAYSYNQNQTFAGENEISAPRTPEKEAVIALPFFGKFARVFKFAFFFIFLGSILFLLSSQIANQAIEKKFYSYLSASFEWMSQFAQVPQQSIPPAPETNEFFAPIVPEPYLTINAETDISAPLNVKEQITAPSLSLLQDEFRATLTLSDLTSNHTYTFPNQSGIVCLTTGNCFGTGGIVNRLAKFISQREIGASSIEDLYGGLALTIDSQGQVGIGRSNPDYPLHVTGRIQATGDICTDLVGGRCLSTLPLGGAPSIAPAAVSSGIGGSGTTNYLPLWTAGTTLANSIIYQDNSNIGIGTTSPAYTLDVYGTTSIRGFFMPTGASLGYILTSDASGAATWQAPATGTIPSGTLSQTLRHDGTSWVANSFLYNTGTTIGIATTTTAATLTLSGNAIFSTTTLPQLSLRYDGSNYLNFAISDTQSLIEASKKLVFNSLTGEIELGSSVNLFNAFAATVQGATFISTSSDSTVRKSGELVFRASLPIFRYGVPAQTTSTAFVAVSKTFSLSDSLDSLTPSQLSGATRVYAFLINFADNIATTSSSTWQVYRPNAATTSFSFTLTGQNLSSLDTGNAHMTATTTLPDNDWRLEVRNPSADKSVRIFNIFLLTFDQIN